MNKWLPLVLLSAFPLGAAEGRFSPAGPPPSAAGFVVAHPTEVGRWFVSGRGTSLFETRDGGQTWAWSGRGLGSAVVEAFTVGPDGTAWAAITGGGVARRAAGTDLWSELPAAFPPESVSPLTAGRPDLVVDPGDPTVVYRLRRHDLFRSDDAGVTWQQVLEPSAAPRRLVIDPTDSATLYLASSDRFGGRVEVSHDRGASWQPMLPSGLVDLLALPGPVTSLVGLDQDGTVWRSTDAGASWLTTPDTGLVSLTPGRGRTPTLFGSDGRRLQVSRDFGATWTPRSVVPAVAGCEESLGVAPGGRVLVGCGGALLVGESLGTAWHQVLEKSQGRPRFSPRDGRQILVAAGAGVFSSRDAGRTWSWRGSASLVTGTGLPITVLLDVIFDRARDGAWWAAAPDGVYTSPDEGATWRRVTTLIDGRFVVAVDGRTILAAGCGLKRSDDGGRRWRDIEPCRIGHPTDDRRAGERRIVRLLSDPRDPRQVFAEIQDRSFFHHLGDADFVSASYDGGRTWRRVGAKVIRVAPGALPGEWYGIAAETSALSRSTDRGRNWTPVGISPSRIDELTADPAVSGRLWLSSFGGPLRSDDGGASWSPAGEGLAPQSPFWLEPAPGGRTLFAGSNLGLLSRRDP